MLLRPAARRTASYDTELANHALRAQHAVDLLPEGGDLQGTHQEPDHHHHDDDKEAAPSLTLARAAFRRKLSTAVPPAFAEKGDAPAKVSTDSSSDGVSQRSVLLAELIEIERLYSKELKVIEEVGTSALAICSSLEPPPPPNARTDGSILASATCQLHGQHLTLHMCMMRMARCS